MSFLSLPMSNPFLFVVHLRRIASKVVDLFRWNPVSLPRSPRETPDQALSDLADNRLCCLVSQSPPCFVKCVEPLRPGVDHVFLPPLIVSVTDRAESVKPFSFFPGFFLPFCACRSTVSPGTKGGQS